MEQIDWPLVISILSLVVAGIGAIINFWYSHRNQKNVEKQLRIQQAEHDKKKSFLDIAKQIETEIEIIRTISGTRRDYHFQFEPLWLAMQNIHMYIHDNNLEKLKIKIVPKSMKISLSENSFKKFNSKNELENFLITNSDVYPDELFLEWEPKNIVVNKNVGYGNERLAIKVLESSCAILLKDSDVIKAIDFHLLDDVAKQIKNIRQAIFDFAMTEAEIVVRKDFNTKYIYNLLREQIGGFAIVSEVLTTLNGEILDRLTNVQKELYRKYQD